MTGIEIVRDGDIVTVSNNGHTVKLEVPDTMWRSFQRQLESIKAKPGTLEYALKIVYDFSVYYPQKDASLLGYTDFLTELVEMSYGDIEPGSLMSLILRNFHAHTATGFQLPCFSTKKENSNGKDQDR